jgi:hypothetical protein
MLTYLSNSNLIPRKTSSPNEYLQCDGKKSASIDACLFWIVTYVDAIIIQLGQKTSAISIAIYVILIQI